MDPISLSLAPLSTMGIIWFVGLFVLLWYVLIKTSSADGFFKYLWVLPIVALISALGYTFVNTWSSELKIEEQQLTLSVPFYSHSWSISEVNWSKVQLVDLTQSSELAISHRENGVGLPEFKLGYFRLKQDFDGKTTALLAITEPRHVLVLPTDNLVVMVSLKHPQQALLLLSPFTDEKQI
ncbi:hypothetical protein D5018_14660 [Parashewanella curva]|uniref:Bacterial Pleckstrin homology domain-containing protein n=1 Tax=Parashewanella curva TaxID=2338552 RepID=A0A3L8PWY7_9GAMM|nr:hypothetical protein [Parashewanella curva]RLV58958.1 hypothetical protein D5018_14660 [Parashewanella curva]